jgi:hypothetical protein
MAARIEQVEGELSEMRATQVRLFARLDELIPAVARLEVKSGLWGAVGGLLATAVVIGGILMRGM